MVLRAVLIVVSFVLIGAHFLRYALLPLTMLSLAVPLLLFIKRRWILILLQVLAYLGAAGWILTLLNLVGQRMRLGQDWHRLPYILGSVAAFTVISGLLLNSKSIRERYPPRVTARAAPR